MANKQFSKKCLFLAFVVVFIITLGTIFQPYSSIATQLSQYHQIKPKFHVAPLIPDATSNQTVVYTPKRIVDPLILLTLPSITKPYKPNAIVILIESDDTQPYLNAVSMIYQLLYASGTRISGGNIEVAVLITKDSSFLQSKRASLLGMGVRLFIRTGRDRPTSHKAYLFKLSCYKHIAFYTSESLFLSSPEAVFDTIADSDNDSFGGVVHSLNSSKIDEGFLLLSPSESAFAMLSSHAKDSNHTMTDLLSKVNLHWKKVPSNFYATSILKQKKLEQMKQSKIIAISGRFWALTAADVKDISVLDYWKEQQMAAREFQEDLFGLSDFAVPPYATCLIFMWLLGAGVDERYDIPRLIGNRNYYASQHPGVDIFIQRKQDANVTHPVWQKPRDLERQLETHEWFWLLDSDALIMNHRLDLFNHIIYPTLLRYPDPSKIDIIIGEDCNGINAGSFLVRRSEWSKKFVPLWKSKELQLHYQQGLREQWALKDMIDSNEIGTKDRTAIVPLFLINCYARSVCGYKDPDGVEFLYHAPGYGYGNLVKHIEEHKIPELKLNDM